MREREVTSIIAQRLRAEGALQVQERHGQMRGADIEARLPHSRRMVFIEVKGETQSPEGALATALYQILTRYDGQSVCALAFPFTPRYQNLLRGILAGIQRLGLHLLFVQGSEIWYLSPHAVGFFPERPSSLIEVLEK